MERRAPIDARWGETAAALDKPSGEGAISLMPPKEQWPTPERSPGARRSALLIEILSFVLIAFLVSSALLFNFSRPGKVEPADQSAATQPLPKPTGADDATEALGGGTAAFMEGAASDAWVAAAAAAQADGELPEVQPTAGPVAHEALHPPETASVAAAPEPSPPAEPVRAEPPVAVADTTADTSKVEDAGTVSAPALASVVPDVEPVQSASLPAGSKLREGAEEPAEAGAPMPAPPEVTAVPPVSPETAEALMKRGDDFLRTGDIVAARLSYERAAAAGASAAATGVAKTYDPLFLAQAGVRGLRGDPARAALWYGRAAAAGDRQAQQRLRALRIQYPQ